MILIDRELQRRHRENNPIRVGMVGAGFMARGIALQIRAFVEGMDLVAIANRNITRAIDAFDQSGAKDITVVKSAAEITRAISSGQAAVTEDPYLLCESDEIDVIVEVTGSVEYAAGIALATIEAEKHLVLMNAELDGTIGPILKVYADRAGVVYTNSDGDQPGVIMNLYRFVKGLGVRPVLCGNIKGLHDPYRNPTTQMEFARTWGQAPHMVTSFADGTKISFEQAIVANATGMRVAKRGMNGPTVKAGTPIMQAASLFDADELMEGPGIVDYVVGADPGPGVFVLGTYEHPVQRHYLDLYKLGKGPLYCFYSPYHLCHFEVPNTIARAELFGDATISPERPEVEVITAAKTDLKAGQQLDGLGHYMTYGLAENSEVAQAESLLPIGLAEGCVVNRDLTRDEVLTYTDVDLPDGRLCDKLRAEQSEHFAVASQRR